MTCFCTQTVSKWFSVILLLFPTNMVKKCWAQKNRTLNMKTCQKWKPTWRCLRFSPKSFVHNFGSFCRCFPSLRLKNITVKNLGHLGRKLSKVTNQHMMTCFSTQTICTSFSVTLLLFPINMVKTCSKQKNRTLNTKTCQKPKQTQHDYIFHSNLLYIILDHFFIVSHNYGSKI